MVQDFIYVHLGYVEISLSRFYYFYVGNTQNNFFFWIFIFDNFS